MLQGMIQHLKQFNFSDGGDESMGFIRKNGGTFFVENLQLCEASQEKLRTIQHNLKGIDFKNRGKKSNNQNVNSMYVRPCEVLPLEVPIAANY